VRSRNAKREPGPPKGLDSRASPSVGDAARRFTPPQGGLGVDASRAALVDSL